MPENLDDEPLPPPAPLINGEVVELHLLSTVLGDPDNKAWAAAQDVPPAVFTYCEDARRVWASLQAGIDSQDLFTLSSNSGVPMTRLIEWLPLDRAGATFSSNLRTLRDRARTAEVKRLAGALSERPDLADVLGPKIALAGRSADPVPLPAVPASRHLVIPRTDRSCLLGNRFLNRGDGAILAGNSGMGKSSLMLQASILFALGRDLFGIKPNGALKSLIMQSEDSEGDIAEVMASLAHALKLTPAEVAAIDERVLIVTDRVHRGETFVKELRLQVRQHQPDFVWLNPLAAFIGGDISDAEQAGIFLREQLNGVNADCRFGYFIVTHTTKPPTDKGKGEKKWSEVQYNMAGSYDLVGWARAILSLQATETPGEFDLILAKRGTRADVRIPIRSDATGLDHMERTTIIPLRHSTGKFQPAGLPEEIPLVAWETRPVAASEAQGKRSGRPKQHSLSDLIPIFSPDPAKAEGFRRLHRKAEEIRPISKAVFQNLLADAVTDGFLVRVVTDPLRPVYHLNTKPKASEEADNPGQF